MITTVTDQHPRIWLNAAIGILLSALPIGTPDLHAMEASEQLADRLFIAQISRSPMPVALREEVNISKSYAFERHKRNFTQQTEATTISTLSNINVIQPIELAGKQSVIYSRIAWMFAIVSAGLAIYAWRRISQVTRRNQELEQLLMRNEEAVAYANAANEAKGQFLANMSHEIRTPLNAIVGLSYLALQGESEERSRNYLEKIVRAANLMIPVINDILDLSKIEAGKLELDMEEYILLDVFEQIIDILHDSAALKNVNLKSSLDREVPTKIIGDAGRLSQILTNLVSNAIKFSAGGEVILGCKLIRKKGNSTEVIFWVKDEGIGIDKMQQMNIFNPYQQANVSTAKQYGGTGLGLAITWKLAHLMHGRVWVDSSPGKGSTFNFQVMLTNADAVQAPRRLPSIDSEILVRGKDFKIVNYSSSAFKGVRVLLVEDNIPSQEMTVEILDQYQMEVNTANDGEAALKILKEGSKYDLILMDCHMPIMDGFEATMRMRHIYSAKELPIIALTADVIGDAKERALTSGMNDFISKPINVEALLSVIHRWAVRLQVSKVS